MIGAKKLKRKILYCFIFLTMFLTAASCGARDNPDSAEGVAGKDSEIRSGESSANGEEQEELEQEENHSVAVADYHYLEMQWQSEYLKNPAINEDWIYYIESEEDEASGEGQRVWCVFRNQIDDTFQPEKYVLSTKKPPQVRQNTLFLDREGNCYLFWAEYEEAGSGMWADEPTGYSLEKYGEDMQLIWQADCAPEQFKGIGESLREGTVSEDGRIFLYQTGPGGTVFSFGADGSPEEIYTPELESLEGVAVGKDGRAYAWCVTGAEPQFVEIGGTGGTYVCPMKPLQVYGGREDGLYLCDGKGLWSYVPETGDVQKLWGWDDEFVQMDVNSIRQIFRGGDAVSLLCEEQFLNQKGGVGSMEQCDTQTLVSVRMEDSQDCPERQTLTMEKTGYYEQSDDHVEDMVRLYNRQSRKYKVEIIVHSGSFGSALKALLLRGEGPDLMSLKDLDVTELAEKGALEDLGEYYASSSVVDKDELLPAVRQAGEVAGKDVLVIPAFTLRGIEALRTEEMEQAAADWTPLKFLELAEGNRMFRVQSPEVAFWYCMGITPGDHFIDYENRESHFDSEEFRQILESCARWKVWEYRECELGDVPAFFTEDWEWLMKESEFSNAAGFGDRVDTMEVGYPGWNSRELKLVADEVFAVNSASENKEGAWDFLEYVLSDELQQWVDWAFPARADRFDECLKVSFFDEVTMEERQLTESEMEEARALADAALYDYRIGFGDTLRDILSEEASMYFAGDATLDATVAKIQSRVQLYLDEQ